jgi:predicted dinucleotide-binding enzyme
MSIRLESAICVIGGGPAGAATARRLAQLGHSVVEAAVQLSETRRALRLVLSSGIGVRRCLMGVSMQLCLSIASASNMTCNNWAA